MKTFKKICVFLLVLSLFVNLSVAYANIDEVEDYIEEESGEDIHIEEVAEDANTEDIDIEEKVEKETFNDRMYNEDKQSIFQDVYADSYYYEAVEYMADNGYMIGYDNNLFLPNHNITLAEVLTVLYRVANYKFSQEGEYWYSNVYDEAISTGIITEEDDPNKAVTRYEIATYIIKIFKIDTENLNIENAFIDINDEIVNTLYQNGIFEGIETEYGNIFNTDANIMRGDLCLVLTRLIAYLDSVNVFYIGDIPIMNNPTSERDFFEVIKAIGLLGEFTTSIKYSNSVIGPAQFSKIKPNIFTAFEKVFMCHPEYMSFTSNLYVSRVYMEETDFWYMILNFGNEYYDLDAIKFMYDSFFISCERINEELKNMGLVSESNEDILNIQNIFEYVIYNVDYDYEVNQSSFTGYGATEYKKAVCQGYTALFNQLCILNGYEAEAVVGLINGINDSHMWSKVKVGGKYAYFDTTFADLGREDYYDKSYFNMTYDEMLKDRVVLFENRDEF